MDMEAAASRFTREEREDMQQKLDAMDAAKANAAKAITQCALETAAAADMAAGTGEVYTAV
jgi:hypothetical protein